MNIAFGMIIFNSDFVLEEALKSVYPFASQILVAEGPVKFWQDRGFTTSVDRTNEILHGFQDPDGKIKIHHGQYSEKDEQCNAYMQNLSPDADYIWNLDADEIFKPEDIERIICLLKEYEVTTAGFKSLTFYGGFDRYLTGFEEGAEFRRISRVYPGAKWQTHRPPTIANSPWTPRHLNYNDLASLGIRMYHYSYVFPRQVMEKVAYYKGAVSMDNCIDNYYEEIFLPWVNGDDAERQRIETKWSGVHEFKPSYRGPCYTAQFRGHHPDVIKEKFGL